MKREEFYLTPQNLSEYLHERNLGGGLPAPKVTELGGGVSNIVLLIEFQGKPERRWVAKQSLEKLRVKDDWKSDRARIFREADAIRALRPVLGEDALPEVVHVDCENYFFIMTAAPPGCRVWKESLLAGRPEARVAREAGRLLARIITASRQDPTFENRFCDKTVFDQLRVDPYYRTTAARHSELGAELEELAQASLGAQTALVHGDYSPKNMLVKDGKIFLIDFEVAHWGDPAFDAGFLLNHLFLKTLHQPRFREVYFAAAREFWRTLVEALGGSEIRDFERMTLRHLGGLMLARIDGKSPVEYIREEETKERVRRVAKRILLDHPEKLEEALSLVLGASRTS